MNQHVYIKWQKRVIASLMLGFLMVAGGCSTTTQGTIASDAPSNAKFEQTQKAAEQGDAGAQIRLGLMYYQGQGVTQDYKQAVYWYRKAAEQGASGAQYNLGFMYQNGQGVAQDYKQAVYWYRKAAEQGFAPAQFSLGLMYGQGKGVAQSDKQAYVWSNIAAALGLKNAIKLRELAERLLTASQLAKAKALSEKCMQSHYQQCE